MRALFWFSIAAVLYPYVGYPLALVAIAAFRRRGRLVGREGDCPSATIIIPVHNEAERIPAKLTNTAALRYPGDKLQVVFVSDGSTDETAELIRRTAGPSIQLIELPRRAGKAAALNAGLGVSRGEIVVFSDASIELEPDSLINVVQPFSDARVGCVSGEDRIAELGGEGLYGRFELMLRRLESAAGSIVGASGSFYAQRRVLCAPFTPGMAPGFMSVLRTVASGFRAVSEPHAVGRMLSVKDPRQEFERKVRTLLRGMTTLFEYRALLNPFRFPFFSFALLSHKLLRWVAPAFLLLAYATSLVLAPSPLYLAAFVGQTLFYLLGLTAWRKVAGLDKVLAGRVALYFISVNVAVCAAWAAYLRGERQEIWTPSRRCS